MSVLVIVDLTYYRRPTIAVQSDELSMCMDTLSFISPFPQPFLVQTLPRSNQRPKCLPHDLGYDSPASPGYLREADVLAHDNIRG